MKKFLPILAIPFTVILLCFAVFLTMPWLMGSGAIHISTIQGFAVSSDGTVFVGYRRVIEAYKDGSLVFTFRPPAKRDYRFYIEDDKLIIGTASGSDIKIYDTSGNYVEDCDLSSYDFTSTAKEKKEYTAENGDVYTLHRFSRSKPFEIRRNNETIIKESTLDYHFHELPIYVLFCLSFISMLFLVLAVLGSCQWEFWGISSPPWIGSNYD